MGNHLVNTIPPINPLFSKCIDDVIRSAESTVADRQAGILWRAGVGMEDGARVPGPALGGGGSVVVMRVATDDESVTLAVPW